MFPSESSVLAEDSFLCHSEKLQQHLHCILEHWATGGGKWVAIVGGTLLFSVLIFNPVQILSIETFRFEWIYAIALYVVYFGLLLEFTRFIRSWTTLQHLLHMLERHMLAKAFRRLSNKQPNTALWHWGGNAHAFTVIALFLNRLKGLSDHTLLHSNLYYEQKLSKLQSKTKYLMSGGTPVHLIHSTSLSDIKTDLNEVFKTLVIAMLPEWRTLASEPAAAHSMSAAVGGAPHGPVKHEVPLGSAAHPLAEELIALRFTEIIAQVNLQLKNNLEFIAGALILAVISLNSYPFEPRHSMTSMITIYFFAVSAVFLVVFLQMSRNTILSYLSHTTPGKLDGNIFHVLSFGGLPMLAVISSQFPSIGGFLFAWVKPALENLR